MKTDGSAQYRGPPPWRSTIIDASISPCQLEVVFRASPTSPYPPVRCSSKRLCHCSEKYQADQSRTGFARPFTYQQDLQHPSQLLPAFKTETSHGYLKLLPFSSRALVLTERRSLSTATSSSRRDWSLLLVPYHHLSCAPSNLLETPTRKLELSTPTAAGSPPGRWSSTLI